MKNKLSKPAEQKQNNRYGDHLEGYQLGGRRGRMGEMVQGLRSTNWQVENIQGEVKNSIGNGIAKELTCMTHGHELRGGGLLVGRWVPDRGGQRGKYWDN